MTAYYNENNPKAAAWLRELIAADLIPAGDVDERDIRDVEAETTAGYDQCHFFAGIGGWPFAFRLAGWPDDRPVWSGSCPCQPFSVAGQGKGHADARDLWPEFRRLIDERRPAVVFGEQVVSPLGRQWLAGVRLDLEAMGYAVGAADLCAAGEAAPHIRQRFFWVGFTDGDGREPGREAAASVGHRRSAIPTSGNGDLSDAESPRCSGSEFAGTPGKETHGGARMFGTRGHCETGDLSDAEHNGGGIDKPKRKAKVGTPDRRPCFWDAFGTLEFSDGKTRRIEPGLVPVVNGFPGRVDLVRGYGNAIVPQVAATFIEAATEAAAGLIRKHC